MVHTAKLLVLAIALGVFTSGTPISWKSPRPQLIAHELKHASKHDKGQDTKSRPSRATKVKP